MTKSYIQNKIWSESLEIGNNRNNWQKQLQTSPFFVRNRLAGGAGSSSSNVVRMNPWSDG